ncbi:MAG TPA: hypothetical protein VD793_02295, partial [Gemmatimonadales bacterium]|nr:hypothetical protein [Gemmatimonadales bacterium]
DSTNVLRPAVTAVTRVALEHTDYLGDSLAGIAREKAGIAKSGVPLVIGEEDPEIRAVLADVGRQAGAAVTQVPPGEMYRGPLGLAGEHQRRNAAIAAAVLEALPPAWRPGPAAMAMGFASARIPGRFDRRGRWVFDVAHNPDGMRALAHTILAERLPRPLHALVGILGDKAWGDMLRELMPVSDALWVTDPPSAPAARRWDLETVGRELEDAQAQAGARDRGSAGQPPVRLEPDFDRALAAVQRRAGTVLVTGSFHTVGDAMRRLPGFAPLG